MPAGNRSPERQPPGGGDAVPRHFRFPIALHVICRAASGEGGTGARFWFSRTVNLSAGGVVVLLPQALPAEDRVAVLLDVEGRTLHIDATVQWVGGPALPDEEVPHGLAFVSMPAADREHLDAFLLRLGRQVRRRSARAPLDLPVTVERAGGSPLGGWTADVGEGGVQLVLPAALPPETTLTLSFATSRGPVRVEAWVRWVGEAQQEQGTSFFRHGCQFKSEAVMEQLAADLYIEEFLRHARGEASP